jgi:hypothetical protein
MVAPVPEDSSSSKHQILLSAPILGSHAATSNNSQTDSDSDGKNPQAREASIISLNKSGVSHFVPSFLAFRGSDFRVVSK